MDTSSYPKIYLYRRIVQAKLFIDRNFADAIDLENIADTASFSRFHFIRLFKKIYNKTPHQYLIRVRVEKAMEFLKVGMPVTVVCESVGFESPTTFTGLFKRIVGLTPSAYQHREAQRKADISSDPLKFIPGCFAEFNGWAEQKQF
jgi:AraC-like DNA-binding protein